MEALAGRSVISRTTEVFTAFLRLGLSAFGGPIAHLGYFRQAFVVRRGWLDEATYGDLVALCQFLPGPTSSQVGFAIGLRRAGPLGAAAAWMGFTLPSALIMIAIAYGAASLSGVAAEGLIHGLKLVAVAVVAQAVWGMARSFAADRTHAAIALLALAIIALMPSAWSQIIAIAGGAALGLAIGGARPQRAERHPPLVLPRAAGFAALAAFAGLLGLPLLSASAHAGWLLRFDAFYRAGALVFGGGHVVLPLLKEAVVQPGWVSPDQFLAGYGAAQALPGPLFTVAAFLGAAMPAPYGGMVGALLGLTAIFLPGFLILIGVMPFWEALRQRPRAQAAMAGTNAAVVGILAGALYDPLWTGAVADRFDVVIAAAGFVLLSVFRAPAIVVVIALGLAGVVRAAIAI